MERWGMVWFKLSQGEELVDTQLGADMQGQTAVDWVAADYVWVVYSVFAFPSPVWSVLRVSAFFWG